MTLTFICGSLEQGRDGVGDYTRRLAGELIRQGQKISIIALNEKNIKDILVEEIQESEGSYISVLRLSNRINYKERFSKVKEWVDNFNPEWLSLQYVPFSFQNKGLPFGLSRKLKRLGKGRKWHIMFHELWVGIDAESPVIHKLWGHVQKLIIHRMIKILSPGIVNTHSQVYQYKLNSLGHKVDQVALISNIPLIEKPAPDSISPAVQNCLKFIVFGTIHYKAPFCHFANCLAEYASKRNKSVHFIFIGKNGNELANWKSVCEKNKFIITDLGEQSSNTIAQIISTGDFGISSTPLMLIEKSGTVAAFQLYNVPVISVARSWAPATNIPFSLPSGIIVFNNKSSFDQMIDSPPAKINRVSLPLITKSLTEKFHINL